MDPLANLTVLEKWFHRNASDAWNRVSAPRYFRHDDKKLIVQLLMEVDYLATLEIASQARRLELDANESARESVLRRVESVKARKTVLEDRVSGRLELVDRLRRRLESRAEFDWAVEPAVWSHFLQLSAEDAVRTHFAEFEAAAAEYPLDRAREFVGDPRLLARVLLEENSDRRLVESLRQLDEALDLITELHDLLSAAEPWPMLQASLRKYFEDAFFSVRREAASLILCVSEMQKWPRLAETADEREEVWQHVERLRGAVGGLLPGIMV